MDGKGMGEGSWDACCDDGLTGYYTVRMGTNYTTTQFRWFVRESSGDEMEENEEVKALQWSPKLPFEMS